MDTIIKRKGAGRPRGKAPSTAVHIYVPTALLAQLDAYLDMCEEITGLSASRAEGIRQALLYWLERRHIDVTSSQEIADLARQKSGGTLNDKR